MGLVNLPVALACRAYNAGAARRWPLHGRLVGLRAPGLGPPALVRLGTSDWLVFKEIFVDDEYAAVRSADLGRVRTVVDLGSNVGLSIRYWRMLFPGASVVGVEPDEANLRVCRENARRAGDPAPVLIRACVAGSPRKVTLDRSDAAWAFKMADGGAASEQIDAFTVPQILDQAGLSGEIDLLKCDIEGAEEEVFADCSSWISRVRAIFVEIHGAYTLDRLRADLDRAGYRAELTTLKAYDTVSVVFVRRTTR